MNRRWHSEPDTIISNIRSYFLAYPIPPTTFQKYINKILAEKLDKFVIVYLDNILIYTKHPRQPHIEVVYWVLDQFLKYSFFVNLKKYYFHQVEVHFLENVILLKKISIKAKKIKVVKDWPELKLVHNI